MYRTVVLIFIIFVLAGIGVYLLSVKKSPSEVRATISVTEAMSNRATQGFARTISPVEFRFPQDHGPHDQFQTEWWYFTGNLFGQQGRHFGFQFTLFRNALAADSIDRTSNWATNQIFMGHFALTDVANEKFYAFERFSRAANQLAGAETTPFRVWLEDWSVAAIENDSEIALPVMRVQAAENSVSIDLVLESIKPVVLHGDKGLSRKGTEPGNASYYYSLTRLRTQGKITIAGNTFEVKGLSWLDREWSTSALAEHQVGWDWFSLQLDDGREIMYYQIRRRDSQPDEFSNGTIIDQDGSSYPIALADISLEVLDFWSSPSGVKYPAQWQLVIPAQKLSLKITPYLDNQELNLSIRYWEGAVNIRGQSNGKEIAGQGYVELTGYADSN